ncbi:MAG: hypothetical protein M0Q13_14960 [Methanothrix sp.]|jgi:hypothetical protein|nr:hypothetical protein [Methanothrix sp.]
MEEDKQNLLNIADEYKKIIDNLEKEPHYVDRDGDLFTIICPHCGSKNVGRIGVFFVCSRRHIFSLYTEDGVRKDSELSDDRKRRILGDDLDPKTLMDAHGHAKYDLFNSDDKIPMYFRLSLWGLEYDNRTLNNAKIYLDMFKNKMSSFSKKFDRMYLELRNFKTDFTEAIEGKVDWQIDSGMFSMWMEKAIVIANELDNIDFGNEEIYANLFYIY